MLLNIKAQDMLKVLSDSGIHLNDAKAVVYDLLVRSNTTLTNESLYINIEASELCTVMADSGLEEHESKAIIFDLIVLSENNKKIKNVVAKPSYVPVSQSVKEVWTEPKDEPESKPAPEVAKIRRGSVTKNEESSAESFQKPLEEEKEEVREEAAPRINRRKQVSFSAFGGDAVDLRSLPRNM